jgi:hypothetical protein
MKEARDDLPKKIDQFERMAELGLLGRFAVPVPNHGPVRSILAEQAAEIRF